MRSISITDPFPHAMDILTFLDLLKFHTTIVNPSSLKPTIFLRGSLAKARIYQPFRQCYTYSDPFSIAGAQLGGGGRLRRAPPPAYRTLSKDMSLNRGVTHFTFGIKAMYYIFLPIINIPAPPPLKINQLRPLKA